MFSKILIANRGEIALRIIRACRELGVQTADVQAIHPGYGFLAENSHFAEICRSCKIEFIGPPVAAMAAVGDKVACKKLAKKAKVPTVPGSDGAVDDERTALKLAAQIGYPIIIKAAAGGGGRGMRVAHNEVSLRAGIKQAQAEAENAFKDSTVYIEKYIERGRHVEVQILGDNFGNIVHLWERDCSLQRRHQKLVEESPSPNLPPKVREEICAAAVR